MTVPVMRRVVVSLVQLAGAMRAVVLIAVIAVVVIAVVVIAVAVIAVRSVIVARAAVGFAPSPSLALAVGHFS